MPGAISCTEVSMLPSVAPTGGYGVGVRLPTFALRLPNLGLEEGDQPLPPVPARPGVQARDVVLDGARRQEQPLRDLRRGEPVGDQLEHVELAARDTQPAQGRRNGRLAAAAARRRRTGRP